MNATLVRPEDRELANRQAMARKAQSLANRLNENNRVNPGHSQLLEDSAAMLHAYANALATGSLT